MRKSGSPARNQRGGGVVIVGAGLAGLFTALKLAPLPVTVVSSGPVGEGGSSVWAQAGIAAAVSEGDSPEEHAADTIRAGAGIVDAGMALLMAREARDRIEDLLRYGVPFDKDLEGQLDLAREAAHSRRRILHVKGDTAGRAIMAALMQAARNMPSIQVIEGFRATDLIVDESGAIAGVELMPATGSAPPEQLRLSASAIVLATGGAGQLFAVTTNPRESRGEGIAIAARAGAVIADAEFVQFHPTALAIGRDPAPLATEALRGEGALLINARGERFTRKLHEDAELGPRDVVARGVYREVMSGRGAFLDCRKLGASLSDRFPTVFALCEAAGIDPRREPIPIAPAAHYHMGGILTDADGRTSVEGLWACGEVASTGVHGANRLASNSLLEAVVFGARVASDVAKSGAGERAIAATGARAFVPTNGETDSDAVRMLRSTMTEKVGLVRDKGSLIAALRVISRFEQGADPDPVLANMLIAAKLVTAASLARKESRGAQFRSDYPQADPALAVRTTLTLADAEGIAAAAVSREERSPRAAIRA